MADKPSYAVSPILALARITSAVTTRDGTGSTLIYSAAAVNGVRAQRVTAKAQGTTVAGTLALYVSTGSDTRLLTETLISAVTATAAVTTWETTIDWSSVGLWLPAAYSFRASVTGATAATLASPIDLVLWGAIA